MNQLDLKKEMKDLYQPSSKVPELVEVPALHYLTISGIDARETNPVFQGAIQALFGISYKLKGTDYKVMPLEGLWCADNMNDFIEGKKENWHWTLMILQPEFITNDEIETAKKEVKAKIEADILNNVKLETFKEGLSAQIMHIGPFSEEYDNIQKIHKLIKEQGGSFDGKVHKHHEVYLSDFRSTAPEKLKTIIRQPFIIN